MHQVNALQLAHAVQQTTNEEGVPERSHHRKHQDGAQVFSEGPDGKKITRVQDDGRKQVEEEDVGLEDGRNFAHEFHETSDQETHHDEQTALRYNRGNARDQVEP